MAGITKPKGKKHYRIEYYDVKNQKRSFYVPTGNEHKADSIRKMVERLIEREQTGEYDHDLSKWLQNISDVLRQRLEKVGLLKTQKRLTLGQAASDFIDSKRASWKPKTKVRRLNENKWFLDYFGEESHLESVDRNKAVQFLNWLKDVKGFSPIHINSIMKWGTYIYKYATLCGVYTLPNPFIGVRVPNKVQRDKCYISVEYTEKLIDYCPSVQWRTMVAMLRYGGMRPEEALLAEWDGVDREAGTFTFRSPKTEHHEGKEQRTIPLFPRLREAFEEMRMAAETETGIILPQYILSTERPNNGWDRKRQSIADGKNGSLCELTKFIKKAKLKNPGSVPTNMRGSCSTDLKREYPEHAVDAWLGHTREIARRHYDVVTQDLVEQAARNDVYRVDKGVDKGVDKEADKGAIIGQTQVFRTIRNNERNLPQTLKNKGLSQETKNPCELLQGLKVPPAGLEPVTR